jgi:hypothetical protein
MKLRRTRNSPQGGLQKVGFMWPLGLRFVIYIVCDFIDNCWTLWSIWKLQKSKLFQWTLWRYVGGSKSVCFWRNSHQWASAPSFTRFPYHKQRRTTVGGTPLDEWSAHHWNLYPKTHNTHNRPTSVLPVVFKPTISAGERPQAHALDLAPTGVSAVKFRFIPYRPINF